MDTPPAITDKEEPFVEESVLERLSGLKEMFPGRLRNIVNRTIESTASFIKTTYSASRVVAWVLASSAVILVLPISVETEKVAYEEKIRKQERNILLGPEI